MSIATAISVTTQSGDSYLFCEDDGFSSDSLVKYLKDTLADEFIWIDRINVEAHGWDVNTLNIDEVLDVVYKEMDKGI